MPISELPTSADVVIVGAGPAGLAVASQLSQHHKVVVLERARRVRTRRSWFVPSFVIDGDEDVRPYLYPGVKRFFVNTCEGATLAWDAQLRGGYSYVREHEIMSHWHRKVNASGSQVIIGCSYLNHQSDARGVTVGTSRGMTRARLLIDASGHASPIVEQCREAISCDYWWSVFGCIARHPGGLAPGMRVGDYMLWQTFDESGLSPGASLRDGRPVFEYEVLTEHTSFPLILWLARDKVPARQMKARFAEVLRREPTTQFFRNAEVMEWKHGWYPSGGLDQQRAQDRLAFIGDAGLWTTPCGWGMGFILNNYRPYAAGLSELVSADHLTAHDLNSLFYYDAHLKRQISFDAVMSHFLAWAPAAALDRFVELFHRLDPHLVEKVYTLTIDPAEIGELARGLADAIGWRELARLLPREEYKVLADTAFYLGQEVVLSQTGQDPAAGKQGDGRGFAVVAPQYQVPAVCGQRTGPKPDKATAHADEPCVANLGLSAKTGTV